MIRLAFATERISWKAWNILPRLTEEFEITLITYSTPAEIPSGKFHRIISIPTPRHEMLPTTAWRMSALIDQLHREGQIDFAYVYSSIAYLIRSCPYVNVVNGSFLEDFRIWVSYAPYARKLRAAVGFLHYVIPELIACRRADKLITVSKSLGEMVARYYHREPEDVFPVLNGLGTEYLDLYDEAKFEKLPVNIVYTGRLHLRKGILNAVEEFVKRPHIPARFYIVGEGPDRGELERLARTDQRVLVTGHLGREAMARVLQETVVYVFPSLHEGFGLSLVEAMASGHACIVYEMPVNREILGEAGIYVPYNDVSALMDAVEACIMRKDLLRDKAKEAHAKATEYSWDRCGREMASALRRIYTEIGGRGIEFRP